VEYSPDLTQTQQDPQAESSRRYPPRRILIVGPPGWSPLCQDRVVCCNEDFELIINLVSIVFFRLCMRDQRAIQNHGSHRHGSLHLVGFSCGTSPRPQRSSRHLPFQATSSLLRSRRTGSLQLARFISATLTVHQLLMNGFPTHGDDITQNPFNDAFNAPLQDGGFDWCIGCREFAQFPTPTHMFATNKYLNTTWVVQHSKLLGEQRELHPAGLESHSSLVMPH
jgi:hypothetical protein